MPLGVLFYSTKNQSVKSPIVHKYKGHRSQVIRSKLIHMSTTPASTDTMLLSLFQPFLVRRIICINFLNLVPSYNQWGHFSMYQLSILRDRGDGNRVFLRTDMFFSHLFWEGASFFYSSEVLLVSWDGSVPWLLLPRCPARCLFFRAKRGPLPPREKMFRSSSLALLPTKILDSLFLISDLNFCSWETKR